MASTYYSIPELLGSLIYDSEGLFYGYVCGVEIQATPLIMGCFKFKATEIVPDIETLKQILVEKGLEIQPDMGFEELILLARSEGIKIPTKTLNRRVELVKGRIPINEVKLIDIVYKAKDPYDLKFGVVLLNTPRETKYRELKPPLGEPLIERAKYVEGKPVVSLSEGILGWCSGVVVGTKGLGLRVHSKIFRDGYINWANFISSLELTGYMEVYKKLVKKYDPTKYFKLSLRKYSEIHRFLEEITAPGQIFELLNENVEFLEVGIEEYTDVGWDKIIKINDVIIVE